MVQSLKRLIFPIYDWERFLSEARSEFDKLVIMYPGKCPYGRTDFEIRRILGQGGFGSVFLARLRKCTELFAIKVMNKRVLAQKNMVKFAIRERKIVQAINFPFCIQSVFSFQDYSYLYICLPYYCGDDLFNYLRDKVLLDESHAKFYAAQVLLALEYLHYLDIIHRDIKPENILIDANGYLKVIDFGLSKRVKGRTYSLCGTERYLAPEIILNMGHGKSVDWWCFGILIFDMCAGRTPFYSVDPLLTNEKIVLGYYHMPKYFSPQLANLVENILQVDVSKRYGILRRGVNDIKDHPWFDGTDWMALLNREVKAPYIPMLTKHRDATDLKKPKEIKLQVVLRNEFGDLFDNF